MDSQATNLDACESKESLFEALRSIDIAVPLLSEGRTKQHIERWTICRLLSTLAANDGLDYPVSLTQGERPDFQLVTGPTDTGIEVTQALLANYAEYQKLGEQEFPSSMLEPGHFRRGKVKVSEMKELLAQGHLSAMPWMGNSMEREWADEMLRAIVGKKRKLNAPGFRRFEQNWLAIDDCLPCPSYALEAAAGFLTPQLTALWNGGDFFSKIFIDHGSTLICLSPESVSLVPVHSVWPSRFGAQDSF